MPGAARVLVVGSGAAGLMAASVAAERAQVHLLTDRGLGTSNSAVAQGGLQLPPPGDDALARFADDIRRSARAALDDRRLLRFVAEVAPTVELLQRWGLVLDRDGSGELVRRTAGGLSEPRVVTAGDQIGPAVMRVLRGRIDLAGVTVHTNVTVTGVEQNTEGLTLTSTTGDHHADSCVIATGGRTYARAIRSGVPTSNPPNRNEVLYRALQQWGLDETGRDDFQYQPFGIVGEPANPRRKCVPESIGGMPEVELVDRRGRPVIDLRADRRDVTAAMFAAAAAGDAVELPSGGPALVLTISRLAPSRVADVYPRLFRQLERWGRIGQDLTVWPFLHYQLGGFAVGPDGATALPGVFLAGEITGGLHGRNRLMGNGITDALVLGRLAGAAAADYALGSWSPPSSPAR